MLIPSPLSSIQHQSSQKTIYLKILFISIHINVESRMNSRVAILTVTVRIDSVVPKMIIDSVRLIASDPGDLTADAINYFAINFRSPGYEIMLRKSDSFRSCNLDCCCSDAEFFVRCIMTHFNALYGCY